MTKRTFRPTARLTSLVLAVLALAASSTVTSGRAADLPGDFQYAKAQGGMGMGFMTITLTGAGRVAGPVRGVEPDRSLSPGKPINDLAISQLQPAPVRSFVGN